MMKTYPMAVLTAAPLICAIAPVSAVTTEEYVAVANEALGTMNDIARLLGSIKDKASADAAAPQVAELFNKAKEIMAKVDEMGEPGEEIEAELEANHADLLTQAQNIGGTIATAMMSLVQTPQGPCYGSQALMAALTAILQAE